MTTAPKKHKRKKLKCKGCGYTWRPRTGKPKCCPYCTKYNWNKKPKSRKKWGM